MEHPLIPPWMKSPAGLRGRVEATLDDVADALKDALLDWELGTDPPDPPEAGDLPPLEPALFVMEMRPKVEGALERLAAFINEAPAGSVVAASEAPVREVLFELWREALEVGMRLRLEAADASLPPGLRPQGEWARRFRDLRLAGPRLTRARPPCPEPDPEPEPDPDPDE